MGGEDRRTIYSSEDMQISIFYLSILATFSKLVRSLGLFLGQDNRNLRQKQRISDHLTSTKKDILKVLNLHKLFEWDVTQSEELTFEFLNKLSNSPKLKDTLS